MTENMNHPSFPGDQPPDPDAAKAAAREARRRQEVSSWPVALAAVVIAGPMGLVLLFWPDRMDIALMTGTGFLLASAAMGLVWPRIARRLGARAGGYALASATAIPRTAREVRRRLTILGIPFLIMGLQMWHVLPGRQALSLIAAYLALFLAWRAFDLRLWEMAWAAAVMVVLSLLLWLDRGGFGLLFGYALLAVFLSLLPVGVGYFTRWRRWVRSLPQEGKGGAASPGASTD
ncbi:MAG: hypothetical protein V1809_12810 [Planctomycetota bacterium]